MVVEHKIVTSVEFCFSFFVSLDLRTRLRVRIQVGDVCQSAGSLEGNPLYASRPFSAAERVVCGKRFVFRRVIAEGRILLNYYYFLYIYAKACSQSNLYPPPISPQLLAT